MSQHILIAGCGDLGGRVAQLMAQRGHQVWGLRRHPPPGASHLSADPCGPLTAPAAAALPVRWIAADLLDAASLHSLPQGITHLLYCPTPERRDLHAYRASFVQGLRNIVGALGDSLQRTVFISSSAVYGEHHGEWVDENSPTEPLAYNGRILLEAEQWLLEQPHTGIALRLAGLYGPRRRQLLERIRLGQARCPSAACPHWSNRIHIDDAAAASAHLLELANPHALYIGADDNPLPLHILYAHIATKMRAPDILPGSAPANVGSKRLCNARLRHSGFTLQWPDARLGYTAILEAQKNNS